MRDGAAGRVRVEDCLAEGGGALSAHLRHVLFCIVRVVIEAGVVTIGEGMEGEAGGGGGEAARGIKAGAEGDVEAEVEEAVSKAERRVDVALGREGDEEHVAGFHWSVGCVGYRL